MSRSYKKPIVKLTHQIDKKLAHKQVRKKVKTELSKPEPDEIAIEADTRDLGLEEWGTSMGYHTSKILDSDEEFDIERKCKFSRK